MKNTILIFCILFTAAGCQTNKSQSQSEVDYVSVRLANANSNLNSCVNDAKRNPQVARFYEEIIYEKDDSSNKYSLIAKKDKLTDEQAEVLKQAITVLSKCREKMLSDMNGTPFQQTIYRYYSATEAIYIKLIKKEISIGDANEEKVKALAQQRIDWNNAANDFNNRVMSIQNAENESRRQAAAIMLPYMMQQQQNQQLMYQQQMQNLNNNRPVLTSPITTNCLTNGNQTNCTSR